MQIQIGGEKLIATYNEEVLEFDIPKKQPVTDQLNLKGTIRTLDGWNGGGLDNLEEGLLSRSGWALIDDSETNLFDGDPDWNWVVKRPEGSRQDWFFFGYGHEYKKCLMDFTKIAGKIPMPPKYAFGYWWSRYWAYSDSELKKLMEDFFTFDIPIDVLRIPGSGRSLHLYGPILFWLVLDSGAYN